MLLPVIIPFNAIKAGVNCLAAGLIFKALSAVVKD
jgi:riboflavin transporter FmnP